MWIATNRGFLSVVAADPTRLPAADKKRLKGAVPLCVRARNAAHLADLFPGFKVYEWKGRDYPARVFIGQDELADMVAGLIRSVRYPNFKSSVADPELHDAYMGVWSVMHRYQGGWFRRAARYEPQQRGFEGLFDETGLVRPPSNDFEPCGTPGCTEDAPCLNCMVDALDPRSDDELFEAADDKHRAQMDDLDPDFLRDRQQGDAMHDDRYGPYDSGDDRDLDDGAESHGRIAP